MNPINILKIKEAEESPFSKESFRGSFGKNFVIRRFDLQTQEDKFRDILKTIQFMGSSVSYFKKIPGDFDFQIIRRSLLDLIYFTRNLSDICFIYNDQRYVLSRNNEHLQIIKIDKEIQSGSNGHIKKIEDIVSGKNKILKLAKDIDDARASIFREYEILNFLYKENDNILGIQKKYSQLIRFYHYPMQVGCFETVEDAVYGAIGKKYDSDLLEKINQRSNQLIAYFKEDKQKWRILLKDQICEQLLETYQLLLGLVYLHKKGIIHSDLKLENFFCEFKNNFPVAVIGDFGGAFNKKTTPKYIIQTDLCVSEEDNVLAMNLHLKLQLLENKPFNQRCINHSTLVDEAKTKFVNVKYKTDVFAMALSIFTSFFRTQCFPVRNGFSVRDIRYLQNKKMPQPFYAMLVGATNPIDNRISIEEMLQLYHSSFEEIAKGFNSSKIDPHMLNMLKARGEEVLTMPWAP